MKELVDIHNSLKKLFPEAADYDGTNQDGIYTLFNGFNNKDWREDVCSYKLIVQSTNIAGDQNSILSLIDAIRVRTGSKEALEMFGVDIFKNVIINESANTLYTYTISLEIPLYREMEEI